MQTPRPDLDAVLSALTPRERQIVAYVAAGRPNKVIAIDLGISLRTVEAHRARIFTKLRARNAMQLACRLCAHGRSGASPVSGVTPDDAPGPAPAWAQERPAQPSPWLHEPQGARARYAAKSVPPDPDARDTSSPGPAPDD